MDDYPDVAMVRAQARAAWERRQRELIPLQEKIGLSVPWWLVIVAGVFFALSVPHTAQTFEIITPAVGYVAPLGIEFGILYTSFYKRQLRAIPRAVPWSVLILEVLLFLVAIIVNGVGTLQAVAASAGLHKQSVADVVRSFGDFSATRQVALVLVPMAALIIPIGTMVAGEGLAALFLEQHERRDSLDERWRAVSAEVEFYALRDAAIAAGHTPVKAIRWAAQITGYGLSDNVRLSGVSAADTHRTDQRTNDSENGHSTGQGYRKQMDARQKVHRFLEEHPDALEWSVRTVANRAGVGKTVTAKIMSEYRRMPVSGNGHQRRPNDG